MISELVAASAWINPASGPPRRHRTARLLRWLVPERGCWVDIPGPPVDVPLRRQAAVAA